jgi:hypothetical protein
VLWATFPDGVNGCPVLLFSGGLLLTGDLQFIEQSPVRNRLDSLISEYDIDPDRIVFGKDKKYVAESQATIEHFLKRFVALRKCLILSDTGPVVFEKRNGRYERVGAQHVTLMSPLDYHAFGIRCTRIGWMKLIDWNLRSCF